MKVINEIKIKVKESLTNRIALAIAACIGAVVGGTAIFIISASVFFITANGQIVKLKAEVVQLTGEKKDLQDTVKDYIVSNNLVNTQLNGKVDGIAQSVQLIIQLMTK